MSYPLFLAEFSDPAVGELITVGGDEAHHASVVRRIQLGEVVMLADGEGAAVTGEVRESGKNRLVVAVTEVHPKSPKPYELVAVQALAKGDRSDLAVELLTELGADEIVAWEAERSIVRWPADRRDKALTKWRNVARGAAKQSRRFAVPRVRFATTKSLISGFGDAEVLVLHESATVPLGELDLSNARSVMVITGPEGGITERELALFEEAGARIVRLTDHVLRTSTAGGVALAQLHLLLAANR